jgi:hypothetical protein
VRHGEIYGKGAIEATAGIASGLWMFALQPWSGQSLEYSQREKSLDRAGALCWPARESILDPLHLRAERRVDHFAVIHAGIGLQATV